MTAQARAILFAAHDGPSVRLVPSRERFPAARGARAAAEGIDVMGEELDGAELDDLANAAAPEETAAAWSNMGGMPRLHGTAEPGVRLRRGMETPVSLAVTYGEIAAACLDGIALGGRHRALLPRAGRSREEERIVAFLDALVVTPRFPTALTAWWSEAAELPDPFRVWAPILVLTCLDGDDVPAALGAVLHELDEHGARAAMIAGEALALGAHHERREWARLLSADPHPAARAAAVEARSLAGALLPDEIVRLLSADTASAVRCAAARAAARSPRDPRMDELLLAELSRAADGDVAWEVVRALALRGLPAGYFAMKQDPDLLARLGPRALDVLALFGDAEDAGLARQIAGRCGLTSPVLRGLGRYGHAGAAPLLLRALGDEDAAEEAAAALTWLFGLPFDERDALSQRAWRAWISEADLDEAVRYRFGRPYSPACIVEAAADDAELRSQSDLAWLVDEANVRAGLWERPELWRWSPAAEASLAAAMGAFTRAATAFAADPWRSIGRDRMWSG